MRQYKYTFILSILVFLGFGCVKSTNIEKNKAQEIVDKAIEKHGVGVLENLNVEFDFRDKHYTYSMQDGVFEYSRSFEDSLGTIKDVLQNDGGYRLINDKKADIATEQMQKYMNSVNSVIYFAFLPYRLNDEAVNKNYLGEVTIRNKNYHKIKITFEEEGGGEDFDDVFIYWIDVATYKVDYLAYSYDNDDKGIRFRTAYQPQKIGDLLIQDYINYKPKTNDIILEKIDDLYEKGELIELSRIELKNVKITN